MKIGIIGALASEIELLKTSLVDMKRESLKGFTFYTGRINEIEVVLMCCSVGKVNAAIGTQIMIDSYQVTSIINTGIAGALDSSLKTLDIIVSTETTYHDFRKSFMKKFFPYQEKFPASKLLKEKIAELKIPNLQFGLIVTGDEFIESEIKKTEIKNANPEALCVEMEGGAIAHTCFVNQVDFLIIRTISDLADDNGADTYDNFEQKAASTSATIVLKLFEHLKSSLV